MGVGSEAVEQSADAARRSALGTAAVVLAAISVLGLAALLIGDLAGAKGFGDTEESTLANTSWVAFSLGGILALVTGIVAWLLGRRGRTGDVQAGRWPSAGSCWRYSLPQSSRRLTDARLRREPCHSRLKARSPRAAGPSRR
jgi:hypothetical protein